MNGALPNRFLAYTLARLGLGLNIAMHGLVRLPHVGQFATELRGQFSQTILPGFLVQLAGYGIVAGETCVGILILMGLCLRPALVAGIMLMFLLEFGTCLLQQWSGAAIQLTYIGFYAVMLAAFEYHRRPPDVPAGPP
jgi:thiosulfate dehydrogenase [quinone] large subunit